MKRQSGFTLIELMIVVAIIGILAAIAIPAYSTYQAKAKLTAGLAEISPGRTTFETILNNGDTVADGDQSKLGIQSSTNNCTIKLTGTQIICTIVQAPSQVLGATLTWSRATTGVWTCATAGASDKNLAPKTCPQA